MAPINAFEPPRLLNYLTAPHVCVWSATVASCAIPGVFESVGLVVKEPDGEFRPEAEWGRHSSNAQKVKSTVTKGFSGYSDGSIENDLPMEQLSELFNVNHFIVSQVNAHSAVLSTLSLQASLWSNPIYGAMIGYLRFLKAQMRDWFRNIIDFLVYKRMAPAFFGRRGLHQILTQEYEGREKDVTIMPWRGHLSIFSAFANLIRNPTEPEYQEIVQVGEKNTWPFVSRIRAHCGVEMCLERCVQRLRSRLASEEAMTLPTASTGEKIGRTPSFYTSRSLVNLSGLSVLDPNPSSGSLRGVQNLAWLKDGNKSSDDWGQVEVEASPQPLEEPLRLSRHNTIDMGEPKGIVKSTSMANFYYKKSYSDDRLNMLARDSKKSIDGTTRSEDRELTN